MSQSDIFGNPSSLVLTAVQSDAALIDGIALSVWFLHLAQRHLRPILQGEAGDALELADVVGDERRSVR